jgi:isoquinoline 1-oxidoreductase subunit beta
MPAHRRAATIADREPRVGRRRFLGYVLAAPTLAVAVGAAVDFLDAAPASAAIPSPPELADEYDVTDALTDAARPTANLISVQVNADGTASFSLPRAETGQGITTAVAMLIAEEMDLPLEKVAVSLSDARPELLFNQLTGASNSMHSLYTPVRTAAAIARGRLLDAAAAQWDVPAQELEGKNGQITHPSGRRAHYGTFARSAASRRTHEVAVPKLKQRSQFTVIGKPRNRMDAHDIVTGRKKFAMDLEVPGAKPTMVRRAPTIQGTLRSVRNMDQVRKMPGITDVAIISSGVAVRGETFGQCIDAVRALDLSWDRGSVDGESDESVRRKLKSATLPITPTRPVTSLLPLSRTGTVQADFTFAFASNTPLETNCAVADIRKDRGEIWSSLKVPIAAKQEIEKVIGVPLTVHVVQGGGSFGRHLFHEAAQEAAEASQKMGKPVKLMWHRTDDFRHGRTHPMSLSRVSSTYAAGNVISYEQRHTSVRTDWGHGLGEIITASAAQHPLGDYTLAQAIFSMSQSTPYNLGVTTQLLNEIQLGFNTGSMRNVYSPNVCCAQELIIDELAKKMGQDAYKFRRALVKDERQRTVLDKVAEVGQWGRSLPDGMAQGIAMHSEYKAATAALFEIDCRPRTVNRKVRDGVTGPRVTRATFVVDPGLCINPRGLEAQVLGGINDAIGIALTFSVHIKNGMPLEGSWDNGFYTRQWNTPQEVNVIILPNSNDNPCGAGELSVAASMAATACAYGRAVGRMPTYFPINHHNKLAFEPLPAEPSIPQSPTDGMAQSY